MSIPENIKSKLRAPKEIKPTFRWIGERKQSLHESNKNRKNRDRRNYYKYEIIFIYYLKMFFSVLAKSYSRCWWYKADVIDDGCLINILAHQLDQSLVESSILP